MACDSQKRGRRSIRLKGYDYGQAGLYFVTICVQGGLCLLGNVLNGEHKLAPGGKMVAEAWYALPERYPYIGTDAFVVMPNHIHGIILITAPVLSVGAGPAPAQKSSVGAGLVPAQESGGHVPAQDPRESADRTEREPTRGNQERAPTRGAPTLGEIVGAYKSITTNRYIRGVRDLGWPEFHGRFWQRNYYEQIIRNERHLNAIRQYIERNPANWAEDNLFPGRD